MDKPHATIPLDPIRRNEPEARARSDAFRGLMTRRRTVRDFAHTPVDRTIIENAIAVAGSAPSGANQQPWHFTVIGACETKRAIRQAAEAEERAFYAGKAGEAWLEALAPLGTDAEKPFLETAPWLIVVFAQRHGIDPDTGAAIKHYYVNESVGMACGFLVAALHDAGLATLTHTPSPMGFLRDICGRPDHEKPVMIIVAGHAADGARVPAIARKPLSAIADWIE